MKAQSCYTAFMPGVMFPIHHTAVGPWKTVITDQTGDEVGVILGGVFVFNLWDERPCCAGKVGTYGTWEDAWAQAQVQFKHS